MDADKRRVLADAYKADTEVADHHIRSFNQFLTHRAQQIVQHNSPVRIDLRSEEDTKPYIMEFGDLEIQRPQIQEPNGRVHDLYPQEARLRNLTYAGKLTVDARLSILY